MNRYNFARLFLDNIILLCKNPDSTDFKRPVTLFFVCKPGFGPHKDFGKVFFYILRPNFLNISLSSEIVVPSIGMSTFIGIESAPLQS